MRQATPRWLPTKGFFWREIGILKSRIQKQKTSAHTPKPSFAHAPPHPATKVTRQKTKTIPSYKLQNFQPLYFNHLKSQKSQRASPAPPFQTQTLLSKSARTLASLNRTNVHLRVPRDVFSPKTNPVVCGLTRYSCSIHSSHSQIDPPR
jgi:hypothetical protein